MTVRVLVERTSQITGRGPVVAGLLQEGEIAPGDWLVVEGTGRTVQVRGLETHVHQPPEGRRVGLLLRPEDGPEVTAGSTLTGPPAPEEVVAAVLSWTGRDDQETEGRWTARPFRDAWLVTRPTRRRGAPLFLVRRGQVRPVHLARETLEAAHAQLVDEQS